jgi:hypothetical protein
MANFLYNNARNLFLSGGLGWTNAVYVPKTQWRVVLLNKGYATYGMYNVVADTSGWARTTAAGAAVSYNAIPNTIIYKNASVAVAGAGFTLNTNFNAAAQDGAQTLTSFSVETAFTDWGGYSAGTGLSIVDGGVADGTNITFVGIAASSSAAISGGHNAAGGGAIHAFIIYFQSPADTNLYRGAFSPLVAFFDQATNMTNAEVTSVSTGDGITPNGGDITIQWDNGVNRIFKL